MLVQVGQRFVSEQREIDKGFAQDMKTLLSKSKVFQDCHDEFIRDLIVSSNRKEYAPNRYLMEEGQRGDSMFVLFRGVVEVTSNGRYVCKLRSGSIVGEAALLNVDNRRTASVRSVQKCDVAIIFRSVFHSILEKYPWEKKKFQREMKAKLMELGKLIDIKDDLNLEQQAVHCDALKKVPFFAGDDSLHEFVAELAMNATSTWYRPGRVIIQEGDTRCDEMYVLLQGAVEMTACGEFLGRLENDLFGEICMLDLLERRTANVTAATQCHCIVFSRQVVIPILAKYPEARVKLLEHARHRLVSLNEAVGGAGADMPMDLAKPAARLPGCALGFGSAIPSADAHLFSANPIFRGARLDLLQELSHRMETKKVDAGKPLIEEGTPTRRDDFVYWLAKGEVEVWKGGAFIAVLHEGAVVGELAAFGPGERQATVTTRTPVVLRALRSHVLHDVLTKLEDPELMERWEAEMESRMQRLEQKRKLKEQMKSRTTQIDLMFMKLPERNHDGTVAAPRNALNSNESLTDALSSLVDPLSKMPGTARLPGLPPPRGERAALPLTAR
jgi:CRP-like cAMP-binding protein